MDTLEELKNCPLHTSNTTSSFFCSASRDGEALWFKSPTSCSWLKKWSISISLAPSISKAVFVDSTTWNLSLIPSRSYNSSSVVFSRSSSNLESSSFMAFLDLSKALTISKISLTSFKAFFNICCISFKSFLRSQLLVLRLRLWYHLLGI